MAVSAGEGLENAFDALERNFLAGEELTECGIVGNANDFVGDFDGEVKIAHGPTKASDGSEAGNQFHFENGFGLLLNEAELTVHARKNCAVRERGGEIERVFCPVACSGAPAALGEGNAVDDEARAGHRSGHFRRGLADYFHGLLLTTENMWSTESATGLRLSPCSLPSAVFTPARRCSPQLFSEPLTSEKKVALGHGQHGGRLAAEDAAISADGVSLRINFDLWCRIVPEKILFRNGPCAFGNSESLAQPELLQLTTLKPGSADECGARRELRAAMRGELKPV